MSLLRISLTLALYWLNCCSSRSCKCLFFNEADCDTSTECKWFPDNTICRSIQWVYCEIDEKCKAEREQRKINREPEPDFDWPFDCPNWYEGQEYIADDDDTVTTTTSSAQLTEGTTINCEDAGELEGKTCKCAKYGACLGLDCEPGPNVVCQNGGLCCCGDTCSAENGGDAPGGKDGGSQGPPKDPQQGAPKGPQQGAPKGPPQGPAPPQKGPKGSGGNSTNSTSSYSTTAAVVTDVYDDEQAPDDGLKPPVPPFGNDDDAPPHAKVLNVMVRSDIGESIQFGYAEIFGTFIGGVAFIGIGVLCCKSIINYRMKEGMKRLSYENGNRYKYATFEQV